MARRKPPPQPESKILSEADLRVSYFAFNFYNGFQWDDDGEDYYENYAWTVMDGDVVSGIPVRSPLLLLAFGFCWIQMIKKRFKK